MSGREDHIADLPEGDDLVAAEYVLGVLSHPDRLAATARLRSDPAFAALVTEWEARLTPLAEDVDAVQPPDLMQRIEDRLFGIPPQPVQRATGWLSRWLAGGVFAALVLAVGLFLMVPSDPVPLTARLAADGQELVISATWQDGELTFVHEAGPPSGDQNSYELWLIGPSGVPESLGVINVVPHSTPMPELDEGVTLAVSLEPAGGSPTGAPTGPVLVSGVVTRL
ncbi:MAG: anti-sigma factor [Paracoccaceae bacterium]